MIRVAFTIIYNGLHHLNHRNYPQFIVDNFDYWVVIEGLADNQGSTNWCQSLRLPPRSTDGTHEFMESFAKANPNVIYFSPNDKWPSKDDMIRKAIDLIPVNKCFLWQIDIDEHWNIRDIEGFENEVAASGSNCGECQFNHIVKSYIATGKWGSGFVKRLWQWQRGQQFKSHEPPIMRGEINPPHRTKRKFDHYSYYFREDVAFKSQYYSGYQMLLKNWDNLPERKELPIFALFTRAHPIGRSATKLIRNENRSTNPNK